MAETVRGDGWRVRLEAWAFGPAPLHALVALRITLGLVLFAAYAWRLPQLPALYGPGGLAGADTVASLDLDGPLVRNFPAPLYALQHVESPAVAWVLVAVLLGASLAFAAGAATRWSGALALLLHLLFYARNPWAYWGWARMINAFLLYTLLAPSGRVLSVDAWRLRRRHRAGGTSVDARGPAWPLRLVQLHVCTQYLALWPRLESESWLEGRLLFAALVNRHYGRFELDWLAHQELLAAGALAALVLEVGAPVALWLPRVGALWALGLIGLHLGIELTTTVGWWNWVMIPALTAFLPASWWTWPLRPRPDP